MQKTKQTANPSFVRIFIDYDDKKHPIRFSCPHKLSTFGAVLAMLGWTIDPIFLFFIPVTVILFVVGIVSFSWLNVVIAVGVLMMSYVATLFIATAIVVNTPLLNKMPNYSKWVAQVSIGGHNYVKVTKLKSNVFEIPIFDNMFLDYKMVGDFKKFKKTVEITEYDLKVKHRSLFSKKFDKEDNTENWKAVFTFKEIPKKGYLEVDFI